MLAKAQSVSPAKFCLPEELREVSGLVISGPDSLWWHNDGGNSNELFLTDGDGELRRIMEVPTAQNRDWEDLCADDEGYLYIGDFGDNRFRRDDQRIYRFHPESNTLDSILYSYPEQGHYNVEAFFWHQDSLHLFSKSIIRRANLPTHHFVVPAQPGQHMAVHRDSFSLRKRVVTAAAIHQETGKVVLLAYYYKKRLGFIPYSAANVYCFDDYPQGHFLQGRMRSRRISLFVATQYESVDFLNADRLLVASEQTLFIKAKAKQVRWKK